MNLKKLFHLSLGPIGSAGLGLLTLPLVSWFFSTADIGRLSILQALVSMVIMVFSLGLNQAYVREFHEEDDRSALLMWTMLPGLSLLTLSIIGLIFSHWPIYELVFDTEGNALAIIFFFGLICAFVSNFLGYTLRMNERSLAFSMSQVLPKALFLISICAVIWVGAKTDRNFNWLLVANTISLLGALLVLLYLTREDWFQIFHKKLDLKKIGKMMTYGAPLIVGGLAYWGLTTTDRFFIRTYSTFDELGIYAMSVSLAGSSMIFVAIFSSLWHPMVYRWIKEGVDPLKIQKVISWMVVIVSGLWSTIGLVSWLIVYMVPPQYETVQYLMLAGIGSNLLYLLSETTVVGINITRKTYLLMTASIFALAINVGLNFMLVPEYGAEGAAISSVVAFFFFFLIRTEVSANVWISYPRKKMYLTVTFYVLASIMFVIAGAHSIYSPAIWAICLLSSIVLYKSEAKEITTYIIAMVKNRKC